MGKSRGQSSLEALFSFAVLLGVLAVLMLSASRVSSRFSGAVQSSACRFSLSQSALLLDSAAFASLPIEIQENLSGVSFPGNGNIACAGQSNLQEALLHNASVDAGGGVHVQENHAKGV